MKTPEVITAFELFDLDPDRATPAQLRKAYKAKAVEAHPDRAGDGASDEMMKKLNAAYDVALDYAEGRKPERCVCRGFTRNPLCRAHEEAPPDEAACSTCGGKRRVAAGPSWSPIEIDCPTCS